MAKMYYDADANLDVLNKKTIAVIGYGSQGHAQAQNLRESGLDVLVAELEGTENYKLAQSHKFSPVSAKDAAGIETMTVKARKSTMTIEMKPVVLLNRLLFFVLKRIDLPPLIFII